jgi:hypothetical protein
MRWASPAEAQAVAVGWGVGVTSGAPVASAAGALATSRMQASSAVRTPTSPHRDRVCDSDRRCRGLPGRGRSGSLTARNTSRESAAPEPCGARSDALSRWGACPGRACSACAWGCGSTAARGACRRADRFRRWLIASGLCGERAACSCCSRARVEPAARQRAAFHLGASCWPRPGSRRIGWTCLRAARSHPEVHLSQRSNWLRAAVLGANDGILSTSSLVLGVAASGASGAAIITAGVAGLVAGALSMAAGEYVSVSSQRDTERADIRLEERELLRDPDGELRELAGVYEQRGLAPALARRGRGGPVAPGRAGGARPRRARARRAAAGAAV